MIRQEWRQGPSRHHSPRCLLTDLADLGWVKPGLYLSLFYWPITLKKKEIQQKYNQICLLSFLFSKKPTKFAMIFVEGHRRVQADSVFGRPDKLLSAAALPAVWLLFHICKSLRTNTGGRATPAVKGAGVWKGFFHRLDGPNIPGLHAQGTCRRSFLLPLLDDKERTVNTSLDLTEQGTVTSSAAHMEARDTRTCRADTQGVPDTHTEKRGPQIRGKFLSHLALYTSNFILPSSHLLVRYIGK